MSANVLTASEAKDVRLTGAVLSIRQQTAARKLLLGYSIQQAADAARVDERTVRRWLDDPVFDQLLREANTQTWDRIGPKIAALFERAIDVHFAMVNREITVDDPVYVECKEIILRYGGRQALVELAQGAAADDSPAGGSQDAIDSTFLPERAGA